MEKAAIYHRPESEYASLYTPEELRLRLRTKRGDIAAVDCIWGDPYDQVERDGDYAWSYDRTPMRIIAQTDVYDYWGVTVSIATKRVQYGFELTDAAKEPTTIGYGDRGFFPATPVGIKHAAMFRLPYFHDIDRIKVPEWVTHTVWYQIFPERFANGDPGNDPAGTLPWASKEHPGRTDYYGGDLQGVIDHLDYLKDLGINGIYFCPIFRAHSNHKYDTIDYLEIDPDFGDKNLFRELVDEAHKRGIKVMLDAVFNHIGDQSYQWQDVLSKGKKSRFANWFHVHSFPARYEATGDFEEAKNITYDTFANTPHMPKLNTANPEVQEYLLTVAKYWIENFDIDAWRLDVANEVDHHFWRKFAEVCHAAKPDFYILGEVWHSSQPWLQGDQFSAVMNYAYTALIEDGVVKKDITPTTMADLLNQQQMRYADQTSEVMFNVLDSHDTPRLLTVCKDDADLMRQTEAFTYLQKGSPCVYYGDEVGIDGHDDPDCRKCMVWDPKKQDQEMLHFFQKLIALRQKYADVISKGDTDWRTVDDITGLVHLVRKYQGTHVHGVFNLGEKPVALRHTHKDEIALKQGLADKQLAPNGFLIYVKK